MDDVFTIAKPDNPLPLVFDSPHSGSIYPDDFKHIVSTQALRRTEDSYVDELFSSVPKYGGTLLCALFPRSYIDVNRAEDDIDPHLLKEPWPENANPTKRSHAGIGLIRRLLKHGNPLYDRHLKPEEIINRLEYYYHPYHATLAGLIDEAHYNFGHVYHLNCHSMPASTAFPHHWTAKSLKARQPADFVLGNRDATTCGINFVHAIRNHLQEQGFVVSINDPFKGVEIVRRYGIPTQNRHSLQIEINKALYMDEETLEKSADFEKMREVVEGLIRFTADYVSAQQTALAAD